MFLYGHRSGYYTWEDHRPRSGVWKGTSGGEAISFSGCDDHQISIDTRVSSRNFSIFFPFLKENNFIDSNYKYINKNTYTNLLNNIEDETTHKSIA